MSPPRRSILRAIPASRRPVQLVGFEVRPATDAASAHAAYLRALTTAESSDGLPAATKLSRPIFGDASGAFFTVHDTVDGPVTLPINARVPLRSDVSGRGASQFIDIGDTQGARGDFAKLDDVERALYGGAAEASAKHPSLVDQATAGLLKGAISQGLSALTTTLASDGDVLANLQRLIPGGSAGGVGDLFSETNLAAGAGMLTGQVTGMVFGALTDALLGDIGDDSSMGAQLGAFAARKAIGEVQSLVTEQLTELIQGAIDPASLPAPTAAEAKSTSQQIKEFFGGVTSTASMSAARFGDLTADGGKITSSAAQTFLNGLHAARALDYQMCPRVEPGPVPHVGGPIREGNPTILIESKLAARVGHMVICAGPGLQNPIAGGSGDILLGSQTAPVLPPPVPVDTPSVSSAASGKGASGTKAGKGASETEAADAGKVDDNKTVSQKDGKESQLPAGKEDTLELAGAASEGIEKGAELEGKRQQAELVKDAELKASNAMRALEAAEANAKALNREAGAAAAGFGDRNDMGDAMKARVAADAAEMEVASARAYAERMVSEASATQKAVSEGAGIGKIVQTVDTGAKMFGHGLDLYQGYQRVQVAETEREIVKAGVGTFLSIWGGEVGCAGLVAGATLVGGPVGFGGSVILCGVGAYYGSKGAQKGGELIVDAGYDAYDGEGRLPRPAAEHTGRVTVEPIGHEKR